MTKEKFIWLLKEYKTFQENCSKYCDIGIDMWETKYPTWQTTEKFFDVIINTEYNPYGVDWINWFVYENNYGESNLQAYDTDKSLICQTVEDLFNYIQQYKNE